MKSKQACDLQSCFLCRQCLKEWLPAIETHRTTISVKKGTVLFAEGSPVEGIYFVNKGKVKVHKQWGADKELILRIAGNGAILGHRGMGRNAIYPVSATALEPSVVCFIDMAFFNTTLNVNHDFTRQLLLFFADELQDSEKNMRNLAHMTVKGRLAQALLMLHEKFGNNAAGALDIALSRQDLASLTGTTYETVFRMINEMIDEQVIAVNSKDITIMDMRKLQALTAES